MFQVASVGAGDQILGSWYIFYAHTADDAADTTADEASDKADAKA